jgi:hypothetical protein
MLVMSRRLLIAAWPTRPLPLGLFLDLRACRSACAGAGAGAGARRVVQPEMRRMARGDAVALLQRHMAQHQQRAQQSAVQWHQMINRGRQRNTLFHPFFLCRRLHVASSPRRRVSRFRRIVETRRGRI